MHLGADIAKPVGNAAEEARLLVGLLGGLGLALSLGLGGVGRGSGLCGQLSLALGALLGAGLARAPLVTVLVGHSVSLKT